VAIMPDDRNRNGKMMGGTSIPPETDQRKNLHTAPRTFLPKLLSDDSAGLISNKDPLLR